MAGSPRRRRPLRHARPGRADSGCIFVGERRDARVRAGRVGLARHQPTAGRPTSRRTDRAADARADARRARPSRASSIPPWDGKERLNILLIGADKQGGGHSTDTLITVSIDPVTKQVAMFSLPRDTVDVPVPPGPAQRVWGRVYGSKINTFYAQNRRRSDLWPGNDRTRGYNALKSMIGELYGLDDQVLRRGQLRRLQEGRRRGRWRDRQRPDAGRRRQVPGHDRAQPSACTSRAASSTWTASQALRYARSRNTSTDFDRGARQQRVLLSLREQADPQALIPRLPELVDALKTAVKTDIPLDQLDELLGLASQVDTANIRSYVFSPPLYSQDTCQDSRGCVVLPEHHAHQAGGRRTRSRSTRATRRSAQALAAGGRPRCGSSTGLGDRTAAPRLAGYLEYHGLAASAPRGKPEGLGPGQDRDHRLQRRGDRAARRRSPTSRSGSR